MQMNNPTCMPEPAYFLHQQFYDNFHISRSFLKNKFFFGFSCTCRFFLYEVLVGMVRGAFVCVWMCVVRVIIT